MGFSRGIFGAALVALVSLVCGTANAGTQEVTRAANYLFSVQDTASGGFSLARGDLALRDTAAAISGLSGVGYGTDSRVQNAASFLRIANVQTADLRARRVLALRPTDPLISFEIGDLLSTQQSDGGFAFTSGYSSGDVLDTALVLMALEPELRSDPILAFNALSFLSVRHDLAGRYSLSDQDPDLVTNAIVLRAIGRYQDIALFDVTGLLSGGLDYLASQQHADGSFGGPRETALAALAFIDAGQANSTVVLRALSALEAMQEPSGGFGGGDVEITGLALEALRFSIGNLQLAATDVTFSDTNPPAGEIVTISVNVRNTGGDAIGTSTVRITRNDGVLVGQATAPALSAGASALLQFQWDTSGLLGGQIFYVALDADSQILESSEDDNTQRYVIFVRTHNPADLFLDANDIAFNPERPLDSQPTTLSATIHNGGDDATGAFVVAFYDGDPNAGGVQLGQAAVSGVAALGATTVSIGPQTFHAPPHQIFVVADANHQLIEPNIFNNAASKTLVVAQNIDLVISNFDMTVTPAPPIFLNTQMTLSAVVHNAGGLASAPNTVRFWNGNPTGGGIALGDAALPSIPAGATVTVTFATNSGTTAGTFTFYAVADPDNQVDELLEHNNQGALPIKITGGPNAFIFQVENPTASEGDEVTINPYVGNKGDVALVGVTLRFFDGNPASGGRLLGDLTHDAPGNPIAVAAEVTQGIPTAVSFPFSFSTLGMSAGTHSIYIVANPDHTIVESDYTDNTGISTLTVTARPDPAILPADLVVAPSSPEQGDKVTVSATIRELNNPPTNEGISPLVNIYLGDPAAGGTLLLSQVVQFATFGGRPPITLTTTVDTTNLPVGQQQIVCVVDPNQTQRDANRSNNRASTPFTVAQDTKPDLLVANTDLSTTPTAIPTNGSASLLAVVHNTRTVAATGVHVTFYAGDPATNAPVIGDSVIDVPARGQATAQTTLNTTNLLGDFVFFVKVDPNNLIPEADETNNQAYLPIEIRHDASTAPTNLAASPSGNTVNLSWAAGTLSPQRGSFAFRDKTLLETATVDVAPSATASATTNTQNAHFVNDGNTNSSWGPSGSDTNAAVFLVLSRKEYVSSVTVRWSGFSAPANWAISAWDGVQYVSLASGSGGSTTLNVSFAPVKTRRIRISEPGSLSSIFEVNVLAVQPQTTTTFADASRQIGTYTYNVTAVDSDGIETVPATTSATINPPGGPSNLVASIAGNQVSLNWVAPTDSAAVGTLVRRGTLPLNSTTDVARSGTTASASSISNSGTPASNAIDNNTGSVWAPLAPASDPLPWWELDFPQARLLSRVDITWSSQSLVPQNFDVQTWDGTQFLTRLQIRNFAVITFGATSRFDLPDAFFTTKMRIQITTTPSAAINVAEVHAYEVVPLSVATTSFTDPQAQRVGTYIYSVTALDSLNEQGGQAQTTATINPPAAPTNLSAAASGSNVALTWTPGAESNLAGAYVWRDNILLNSTSSTNIAARARASISTDATRGFVLNDGSTSTGVTVSMTGSTSVTAELVFPRSEIVKRVLLSASNGQNFQVQTWDGAEYVTQVNFVKFSSPTLDFTLPQAVRTTRVRIFYPPQTASFGFNEISVFGGTPVSGGAFTDAAPPSGTHTYAVSDVSVLDDEGPQSVPVTFKTGSIEPPQNLVGFVSGTDVHLSWNASPEPNAAGYRVYRDYTKISGTSNLSVSTTTFVDAARPTGVYTYWITAVDTSGNETETSNPVTVSVVSTTPPATPQNLRVTFNSGNVTVAWNASPSPNVVGYFLYKEHSAASATLAAPITATSFTDSYVRGQPRYTYEVTAVDASGNESPRSAAVVANVPAPAAPTNVTAAVTETTVQLNWTASVSTVNVPFYRGYRDGTPFRYYDIYTPGVLSSTAPNFLSGSNYSITNINDGNGYGAPNELSWWVSAEDSYPFTVTIASGQTSFTPIDKVKLLFASPNLIATDFDLVGQTFDGPFTIASVRGGTQVQYNFTTSNPPPRVSSISLRVLAGVARSVGIADFRPSGAQDGLNRGTDQNVPRGPHTYTVQAENASGIFSPITAGVAANVSNIDLAVSTSDITFSRDIVSVGDTVQITGTVHNLGTADADAEAALFNGNPASGGTLISARTLHVPAGLTAEITTSFTIPTGASNIYLQVDRSNAVPEFNESNNIAFRGLPFHYQYRSLAYSQGGLTLSVYTTPTNLIVRNSSGQTITQVSGAVRGQIINVTGSNNSLPADLYTVSGDQKFGVVWGPNGSGATGFYVIDKDDQSYATDFIFEAGFALGNDPKVVVFGRDPNTLVTISNAQTNALYGQATIGAGQHFEVGNVTNQPIHVVASNPVAVVNFADNGYPVPATTGKYGGTHFYVYVGTFQCQGSSLNVSSYQDNTSFVAKDMTTGAIVMQGVLNQNQIKSIPYGDCSEHYIEVTASNTVSVSNRPFNSSNGGLYSGQLGDHGGMLIGNDFLDVNGPSSQDLGFGIAMAYFDNTVVTVQEVAYSDGSIPNPPPTQTFTLNDGQFYNFAPKPCPQGLGVPGCTFGFDPRGRLYRVKSTRPITTITYNGGSNGEMGGSGAAAPIFFGSANIPDLTVQDLALSPQFPAIGGTLQITATFINLQAQPAQNFWIAFYDGAPEQGGRLIHEEFVDQIVEGDEYVVRTTWTVEPGVHNIYAIADSRNQIAEQDETNNRMFVLAGTPANLSIQNSDLSVSATHLLAREKQTLTATVHNSGGLSQIGLVVAAYLGDPAAGGREIGRQTTDVFSGSPSTVNFDVDTTGLTVGVQPLFVKLDPDSLIPTANKSSDEASITFTIDQATQPDFLVSSVTAPATATTAGDVSVSVAVDNVGTPAAGPVTVRLMDGAVAIGNQSVLVTGPQTVNFTWSGPRTTGTHTLVATIDPDNQVAEQDESNNSGQTTVLVSQAQVSLAVATDRASYAPGMTLVASALAQSVPANTTLTVDVSDSVGALVATLIDAQPAANGLASATLPITNILPGTYTLSGRLVQAGAVIARAQQTFQVSGDALLVASLASDRTSYEPQSTVQLIASLANAGTNQALANLTLDFQLQGTQGPLGNATATVDAIQPGDRTQRQVAIVLNGVPSGQVTATMLVYQGVTLLASAQTTFSVPADTEVTGDVFAAPLVVQQGQPETISWSLTALGNTDASGNVVVSVLDSTSGATIRSTTTPVTLPPGNAASGQSVFDTTSLAARPYLATVELFTAGGQRLFRGIAGFTVQGSACTDTEPPVITIAGLTDGQCGQSDVTPSVTATDASSFTLTITLDGQTFTSGTPVTAEGTHTLHAVAVDACGNRSEKTESFTIDRTAPSVSITGVTDGEVTTQDVTPTFSASDANLTSQSATLDGAVFTSGTTVTTEGVHTLVVTAADCAGNQTTQTVSFTIDRTPPVITVTGATDGSCGEANVTPSFTVTDLTQTVVDATLDGVAFTSGTTVTAEGTHTLVVSAQDAAGNTATTTVIFIIDRTPPAISVSGVTAGEVTNQNVTPFATATDANLVSSSFLLDGSVFVNGSTVTTEADHLLVLSASDCAGHTTTIPVPFAIDRTPPNVAISGVYDGQCSNVASLTPVIDISDAHPGTQTITLNGVGFVSGTTITAEGSYTLFASATDAAGNTTSHTVSFKIDRTPPSITVSGAYDGLLTRLDVTLTVSVSDANLVSSSCTLDGSSFASGSTVTAEGDHTLVCTASDCAGNSRTQTVHFTIDRTPPVVTLGGFTNGQCGSAAVTVTATYSDAHLTTTTLSIDGVASASGTTVTANGTHTVVATADDGAGNHTTVSGTFIIDNTAPTITVTGFTEGLVTTQNVTPIVTFSANAAQTTITLDGNAFLSGTTVTAEGDHTLVASATTCAGGTETLTRHFSIDRTAPVITISGVTSGQTYDHSVSPTFSATDAHLTTVTATLDGVAYTSGTTISTNGAHTLVVTANDAANNQAQQSVTFTLNIPSGTVGTTREAANGRILIGIESTNGPPAEPVFLEQTLAGAGYRYVVKNTRAQWLSAVRSDEYGIVILYRTMSFSQDDYKEVNEAVTYGNGVVYIGENPNLDYMREAWGAYKSGDLDPATTVQLAGPLAGAAITVASASGTHAFGKLVMAGGTIGGTVVINNVTYTVATTRALGLGHSVLIDWNAELSTSQALADLYLRAVSYVQPTPSQLVPGGAADVHFPVTAGTTGSYVLSLQLDPLLVVDAADPALSSTSPPTWNFSLNAGQSELFTAVLGLPDESGVFNVTSTLKFQASTGLQTVGTSSLDLSVLRSRAQLLADVENELLALPLTGTDVNLRTDALNHLNQVPDLTNPTQAQALAAISQILTAIKDTQQMTTANVTSVRIDEARLVRAWETRAQ